MTKIKVSFFVFIQLLILQNILFAVDLTATIVNIEGEVFISREGIFLDEDEIDFGTEVSTSDIIQTGQDGYLEIEVITPISDQITLSVMPATTFYLDYQLKKQIGAATVHIERGALNAKVSKLINNGEFALKTTSTTMGVRGTEFQANTSPSGALLVTCKEGRVLCSTEGKSSYIKPGRVYELTQNLDAKTINLPPESIDEYTEKWQALRKEALKKGGALSLNHYATLYLKIAPSFLDAFTEMSSKQDIFDKWTKIINEKKSLPMGEATKDKIALSSGIIRLRSKLPLMEHIFYTLIDLTPLSRDAEIDKDLSETTKRTLMIYKKREGEFSEKLALARYYFKVFKEIDLQASGHSLMPSNSLMDDFLTEDPFFATPPPPSF